MIITRVGFAVLASATLAIDVQPAAAEIYRPWCVQYGGSDGDNGTTCAFTSFEQCMNDGAWRRRVLRPEPVVPGLWKRPEKPGERRTKQAGQAALIGALGSKPLPAGAVRDGTADPGLSHPRPASPAIST